MTAVTLWRRNSCTEKVKHSAYYTIAASIVSIYDKLQTFAFFLHYQRLPIRNRCHIMWVPIINNLSSNYDSCKCLLGQV